MEREHRKLATARYRKGWSQERVAEAIGVTRSTLSQWERGRQTPQEFYVYRLCELYQTTREELGLEDLARCKPHLITNELPSDETVTPRVETIGKTEHHETQNILPAKPTAHALHPSGAITTLIPQAEKSLMHPLEHHEVVDRREAVKTIGSLGLTLLSGPNISLKTPPANLSGFDETASEALQHFATLTETCRHLSEGNELFIAERILWTYLPRISTLALLSFEQQQLAASIVSQSYLLAASLAGHRNNLLERLRYSEQALLYGKLAQDHNLQVVALRQVAISFDCMRQPNNVLHTYQRAFLHLDNVSPLLRACVYADISGAHAQLGHKQDAYRFIEMAYEHFPGQPEQEPGYLHIICRYSSLVFWDGLNRLLFNQIHEAENIFARIDGLQPKIRLAERVRIELLNYQVETFIALRYIEHATMYLEAAGKAALAAGCKRHFQDSSALFQQMKKIWPHEAPVQQLTDLFM